MIFMHVILKNSHFWRKYFPMDMKDRFAKMWRKSREDAGKSQDYIANRLGVSKRTVQNWEQGFSCPSQELGFRWFEELGIQPLPYYIELLYSEDFTQMSTSEDIDMLLIKIIKSLPVDTKKKIMYCISGDHGSSPLAVLELVVAHLQTPLRARLNVAEMVRTNYEMAHDTGSLIQPDRVQPDVNVLNKAYIRGKESVKHGVKSYTIVTEDNS